MTLFFDTPSSQGITVSVPIESPLGRQEDVPSLSESLAAGFSGVRAVDLSISRSSALSEAMRERELLLREHTGKDLRQFIEENLPEERRSILTTDEDRERALARGRESLSDEVKSKFFVGKDLERRAREISMERFQASEEVSARGRGFGSRAAFLLGQFGGFATDPVNIAAMFAGGPWAASVARGAIGRHLAVRALRSAGAEAAIGASAEAIIQPFVQAYRAELGLPSGFEQALINIGFGGLIGGGFGSLGILGRNTYKRLRGDVFDGIELPHTLAERIRTDTGRPLSELSHKELIDEFDRLVAEPTPNEAAARKALQERVVFDDANPFRAERGGTARHVDEYTKAEADLFRNVFVNPRQTPTGAPSPRGAIRPERITVPGPRPQSFVAWVKAQGGIKPDADLNQIGAERFPGILNRNGLSLDEVRERAVQAGFLTERPFQGVAETTPNDVVDLLQRNIAGERIVRAGDVDVEQRFTEADQVNALNDDLFSFEPEIRQALREFDQEDAFDALDVAERSELLFRTTREGEDLFDVIEELSVRSEANRTAPLADNLAQQTGAKRAALEGKPAPIFDVDQIQGLVNDLAEGPSYTLRKAYVSDVYQAWVNFDRVRPVLNASRNIDSDLSADVSDLARRILPDNVGVRLADQIEVGGEARFSLPSFRSPAIEAVAAVKQNKAPPGQWLAMIKKQPGVKKDELDWMGLEQWLNEQGKTVSKDDVLNFMRANQVKLDEKILGGATASNLEKIDLDDAPHLMEDNPAGGEVFEGYASGDVQFRIVLEHHSSWRIDQYNINEKGFEVIGYGSSFDQAEHILAGYISPRGSVKFDQFKIPGGENYKELLIRLPELEDQGFKSKHFNDQEIVHIRFDERAGPDGEKILFINEIQSDLHQDGRRRGFKNEEDVKKINSLNEEKAEVAAKREILSNEAPSLEIDIRKLAAKKNGEEFKLSFRSTFQHNAIEFVRRGINTGLHEKEITAFNEILNTRSGLRLRELGRLNVREREILNEISKISKKLPDAPFKGDLWLELALKRMIKYGVENDFDAISWARSDQIAEVVGADAKSLVLQYDQKIPKFLSKYTKKFDGKLETVRINDLDTGRDINGNVIDEELANQANNILRITPKMREITEQPLFSLDRQGAPEGAFDPVTNVISIVRAATDPERIVRHEAVHALRAGGLFTETEWQLLSKSAEELDWIAKHNVRERYAEIYAGREDAPPFREFMFEEAIADEYSLWAKGQSPVSDAIRVIFEKIRQFLETVGINIRREGLENFEDVFARIESGEVAGRAGRGLDDDTLTELRNVISQGVQESGGSPKATLAEFKAQLAELHQRGEIELAPTTQFRKADIDRVIASEIEVAGEIFHTIHPVGKRGQPLKRRERFSSARELSAHTTSDNLYAPTASFDRPGLEGPQQQLEGDFESFRALGDKEDFDVMLGDEGAFETVKFSQLVNDVERAIDNMNAMDLCKE